MLEAAGWCVVRGWEHESPDAIAEVVADVVDCVKGRDAAHSLRTRAMATP